MRKALRTISTRVKPASPYTDDTEDLLQCRVCGRKFRVVRVGHIATHDMTADRYRKKFGVTFLASNEWRRQNSRPSRKGRPMGNYRPLTREQILAQLRRYARTNDYLSSGFVRTKDPSLFHQAAQVFDSWPNVRRALGLEPEPFLWSEEKVIEAIWGHEAAGHPLTYPNIKRIDPKLSSAARRQFGTWKNAIEMSGIDYETVRINKDRSPQALSRELKAWCKAHGALSWKRLNEHNPCLTRCLAYKYGSIKNAARIFKVPFRPEDPARPAGRIKAGKKKSGGAPGKPRRRP